MTLFHADHIIEPNHRIVKGPFSACIWEDGEIELNYSVSIEELYKGPRGSRWVPLRHAHEHEMHHLATLILEAEVYVRRCVAEGQPRRVAASDVLAETAA